MCSAPTKAMARWPSTTPAAASPPSGTAPCGPQLGRLALAVGVIGLDYALHELVAHHVLAAEADELDPLDGFEYLADDYQSRALVAREVDLGNVARDHHLRAEPEARQEHLHLLGARVLGFVEDDEGVVEGAPAHVGERRDL